MFIIFGLVFLFGILGTNKTQAFSAPNLNSPTSNAELTGTATFSWSRPGGFTPNNDEGDMKWYELAFEENGAVIWTSEKLYSESTSVNLNSTLPSGGNYSWKVTAKKGYISRICKYQASDWGMTWDVFCPAENIVRGCNDGWGGWYNGYCCSFYQPGAWSLTEKICDYSESFIITETKASSSRDFVKYGTTISTDATSLTNCVGGCDNGDDYYWWIVSNPSGGYIFESPGSFQIYASVAYIGCRNGGGWIGAYYRLETSDGRPIPGFDSSFYSFRSIDRYGTVNIPAGVPSGTYKVAFKMHGHYDGVGYRYFYKDFTIISGSPTITVDNVSPISEGGSTTIRGTAVASTGKTISSASWSCNNGGIISNVANTGLGTANAISTATYTAPSFDGSPTKTDICTLSAVDNFNNTGTGSAAITVNCSSQCSGCGGGSDTCGGICSLIPPIINDCGDDAGSCSSGSASTYICGSKICWECEDICGSGGSTSCSVDRDMNWKEVAP
jgi:hypothetical protein